MIQHSFRASKGFTIVELIIVVAVIGILAAIGIVSYGAIQANARDRAILSDLDSMASIQTRYSLSTGTVGKEWDSESGADPDLNFTPSEGNVIVVTVDERGFCIRGYNTRANKNSFTNSFSKESVPGACSFAFTQIANGYTNSCGIGTDRKLYCWGNSSGIYPSSVPTIVADGALNGKLVKSLSMGYGHSCAISTDNLGYCWGQNSYGELGSGTVSGFSSPVAVSMTGALAGKTLLTIEAGSYHTCAVASDNLAYCWGLGTDYQLGNGLANNSSIPVAVSTSGLLNGKSISKISAGRYHSCTLTTDNGIYCWGRNDFGQLGNGVTGANSTEPVAVSTAGALNAKIVHDIQTDEHATCSLASENMYCWGNNSGYQLGTGNQSNSSVPIAVNTTSALNGKVIVAFSTGSRYSCAVASDGSGACWGANSLGQNGNGLTTTSTIPSSISTNGALNGKKLKTIGAGQNTTCAIDTKGKAYCWGNGSNGVLGNGSSSSSLVPLAVTMPNP